MAKPGRNDHCPCGSGKKFKKCCENLEGRRSSRFLMIAVGAAVLGALAVGVASFTNDGSGSAVRVWDPAHGHYHDANGREVP